jgi:hypothetical protein
MKKIFFLFLLGAGMACKKNQEHCWQVYDALGNAVTIVCGKTESEMKEQYGIYFDREDAIKYCWKIQQPAGFYSYPENLSEKMAEIYFAGAVTREKITCGYCQMWVSREKGLYKPNGNFSYKPAKVEQYCGDTCSKIFVGRIVILRDTPDSLITAEFLQKL